jgi:predicted nucleotidyltransferase
MGLSAAETSALSRLRERLEARFADRLAAITLFGSRARSEGHEESDLDVLVLVRALTRDERRAAIDDGGACESPGVALSLVVRDADTWTERSPLAREIARDGVRA